MGYKWFTINFLSKVYRTLGITGASRRRVIYNNVEAAENVSRLWLKGVTIGFRNKPLGHSKRLDQPWAAHLARHKISSDSRIQC